MTSCIDSIEYSNPFEQTSTSWQQMRGVAQSDRIVKMVAFAALTTLGIALTTLGFIKIPSSMLNSSPLFALVVTYPAIFTPFFLAMVMDFNNYGSKASVIALIGEAKIDQSFPPGQLDQFVKYNICTVNQKKYFESLIEQFHKKLVQIDAKGRYLNNQFAFLENERVEVLKAEIQELLREKQELIHDFEDLKDQIIIRLDS